MQETETTEIQPTAATTPSAVSSLIQFLLELAKTVIIVGVLAFVIRYYLVQPFIVEGSSMYPRFQTNDYLLVDKLSYRLQEPKRGDIVVFRYPNNESVNYVKRIIGMPGEKVRIQNGRVSIINKDHPQGMLLDESYTNGKDSTFINFNSPDAIEFPVPQSSYFVLGDNRRASSDSREWGFLPERDLIGRVVLQVYPLDRFSVVKHARYE